MVVSIHQPHYLLWLPYLSKVVHSDTFVVLNDVEFTKNGYQNLNKIKTAQGAQVLTVPVQQKSAQKITEVCVEDNGWLKKHWPAIQQAYSKSPYFARYRTSSVASIRIPGRG